ncbi:MAG: hypothetical protein GY913_20205 [Proteobacteria bacterium]|nr:hypothetical protein [Pseudomonadota bacterium]MCP4919230.1 hypothetical protein [Pseudomonadota bacterium]
MLFLLSSVVSATSVRALVSIDDEGAHLVDAVVVEQDPRAPRGGPGLGEFLFVDSANGPVRFTEVPDPRHRSVVGEHDAVVLERAHALVWLEWPDDARELRLGEDTLVPRSPPPAEAVQESGPTDERLDMVFLGDGYTADELDTFAEDVDRITEHMLSIEPYGAYPEVFNVWRVDQASEDSGVSHYEGSSQVERDTAYGCFYGCGGISRLICCDDDLVLNEVLDEVPGADGVMVLINDPMYGGAGGFEYATSYTEDPTGSQVAVHELGHSLVGLWDEYSYGQAWNQGPEAPNCTREDEPPWTQWLGEDGVDAFVPCSYTNYERPTEGDCMMNTLRDDYCPVCREQAVLAIYGALPGLVVDSWGGEGSFGVELIHPDLDVTWTLGDEVVGSGTEITLDPCVETTLIAAVSDPTEWVRADPDGLLSEEVTWSVECSAVKPAPDPDPTKPDCGCASTRTVPLLWGLAALAALVRRRLH